jgi:hypothetical protein
MAGDYLRIYRALLSEEMDAAEKLETPQSAA